MDQPVEYVPLLRLRGLLAFFTIFLGLLLLLVLGETQEYKLVVGLDLLDTPDEVLVPRVVLGLLAVHHGDLAVFVILVPLVDQLIVSLV